MTWNCCFLKIIFFEFTWRWRTVTVEARRFPAKMGFLGLCYTCCGPVTSETETWSCSICKLKDWSELLTGQAVFCSTIWLQSISLYFKHRKNMFMCENLTWHKLTTEKRIVNSWSLQLPEHNVHEAAVLKFEECTVKTAWSWSVIITN